MDTDKLIPITQSTLSKFKVSKEENRLKSIYLQRWVDYKSKNFSNFLSYAFDKEGNLYRRDFLTENKWLRVENLNEDDLKR
jgi:hypothetical protein